MTTKPKFKFVAAPKEFIKSVGIIDIDGNESTIDFTFIYRTKKQYAELADEGIRQSKADDAAEKIAKQEKAKAENSIETLSDHFYTELCTKADTGSAEYVLKIAKAWDLEDPFDIATLTRLESEYPGAFLAISKVYAKAVSEVRTKN